MAGLTDYAEHKFLEHLTNKLLHTFPTNVWVGFSTTTPTDLGNFTEPGGGVNYSRKLTSAAHWAVANAALGSISNAAALLTATASGAWGTLTHLGLFDTASAGNLLAYGTLTAPQAIGGGGGQPTELNLPIGALQIFFPATGSGLAQNYKKLWLEHMVGKAQWTPVDLAMGLHVGGIAPTDVGMSSIAEPATLNGYLRQAVPGTAWNAASGSRISNNSTINFPTVIEATWGTPTYWFLADGTALVYYAPLNLSGATTLAVNTSSSIAAGQAVIAWQD